MITRDAVVEGSGNFEQQLIVNILVSRLLRGAPRCVAGICSQLSHCTQMKGNFPFRETSSTKPFYRELSFYNLHISVSLCQLIQLCSLICQTTG
uniref:Uncharacterized protein n=1 Tax=Rhipicephalus zambeziensis TaxID=60191 RepID=A0A224YH07_9ACAR